MFKPWVGRDFGSANFHIAFKRLLILGESHHSEEHDVGSVVPNMTLDVFQWYRSGPWAPWMRTLDNIAAAVTGKAKRELGTEGVNRTWDEIAFYNYVPVVAAPYSRQRPSPQHFQAGIAPFNHLLSELRPGAIIVCGYELWARMIPAHALDYIEDPWHPKSSMTLIGQSSIPALRMIHPSTAFSPRAWTPLISQLLERAEIGTID